MPIYDFKCDACGTIPDMFAGVEQREIECPHCGGKARRMLATRYSVHGDMDYYDENLERHVKSRKHRAQIMREKGLSERYGKGWY